MTIHVRKRRHTGRSVALDIAFAEAREMLRPSPATSRGSIDSLSG
jgi:hypothetical protein